MLQFYDLCRLCAQKKRNKMDLFTSGNDEEARSLMSKILLCLSVQMTREDLLPKIVCSDCQQAVEQFNSFRIKCQRAEERLNKMLSLALPNKLNVTQIKQEHSEADFHESNAQLEFNSFDVNDFVSCQSINSLKNVKSEEDDIIQNEESSSDLIQIISEEVVNQQCDDVKQPIIEIISENFNEDFKNFNLNEDDETICEIKVNPKNILEIVPAAEAEQELNSNIQNQIEAIFLNVEDNNEKVIKPKEQEVKKKVYSKRKIMKKIDDDDEIDEKYLTLKQGEVCDIDLEEMDALIKKKQNPNAVFKCNKCNKSFKFFKCLKKHKHQHDSQPEIFLCRFCKEQNARSFEFGSLKTLNSHIQTRHSASNNKKYKCEVCHKLYPSLNKLNIHCKKVHDHSNASCPTCGKVFKNKIRLKQHLRVHQAERPYVCDQCGLSFKWSNVLKGHIHWHNQEKNFLCSECGKKFTSKKNLLEHLNIHSGNRPYVCETCKASFAQLSAYVKHLHLHNEGSMIHKCDKCDKKYSYAFLLKQHLLTHTNVCPYKCLTCNRSFKSQASLCCHVKIHQEKQYGCDVCGEKFAALKTLKDHLVRHTGVKHMCPIFGCGKAYTQRFTLTKHFRKNHPFFRLLRKMGGKKGHLPDEKKEKDSLNSYCITYNYVELDKERRLAIGL